ncbi:threonine/serine exporter family protein [Rothia sp. LK2588]|uniref:threonine/serine exporter ThrE family protein n=1 Tax=Rothia sp. LK2588 TaxID=3114369 RepID=UPI0034CE2B4B
MPLNQGSYPSASAVEPVAGARTAKSGVRNTLREFVAAPQAATVPVRGVARVAQRQFVMAAQLNHERFVTRKEEAREVLHFVVRLGDTMFRYGADTMDIESAIVAVCSAYGLQGVEVNITSQAMTVNYVSDIEVDEENKFLYAAFGARTSENFSHTVVRVVRSWSENYAALAQVYKLIHEITEKDMTRRGAERRLQQINASKKKYPPGVIFAFNLLMAVSFTLGIGGSVRAAAVAFFTFIGVHFAMRWVGALKLPGFFSMMAGGAMITAVAVLVSHQDSIFDDMGFIVSGPHIVGAGLIMLMPTASLFSAAQDAMTGYPLTAAGKLVTTGIGFLGLVSGIASALTVTGHLYAASMDVQQAVFNPPPLWLNIAGMAMGSVMVAATTQGGWRTLVTVALVSVCGQGAYYGLSAMTGVAPGKFNTALGAFTVGALAALLAYLRRAPQSIVAVPGIMFLLPGLTVFRGLYSLLVDGNGPEAYTSLYAAASNIVAMTAGVVMGIWLMMFTIQQVRAVFSSGPSSRERRPVVPRVR